MHQLSFFQCTKAWIWISFKTWGKYEARVVACSWMLKEILSCLLSVTRIINLQFNMDLLRQDSYPPTHWAHPPTLSLSFCLYAFVVVFWCQKNVYNYLFRCCLFLQSTMPSLLFQGWGSVSVFWHWYSRVSHCSMLPTVHSTVLITPTPQTLQPRAQIPGKSLQSPGCCTMEGMQNMSQHHSHLNLPMSSWCDWLEGLQVWGSGLTAFQKVSMKRSNLYSYEIGVALKELMEEKKEERESEKYRKRERETESRRAQQSAVCTYFGYAYPVIVSYNAVFTDSSLWWVGFTGSPLPCTFPL